MQFQFSAANTSDANAISDLVLTSCEKYIFPDTSSEGRKTLRDLYCLSNLSKLIRERNRFLMAHHDGELAGAVAMREEDKHVFLLFVADQFRHEGLGKKLMEHLVSTMQGEKRITLNSSLYARAFYERLGLTTTGPVENRKGLAFIPMLWVRRFK
jgi:N-acetylglutamate synthase-like GNAT family acetyltransferase